MIRSLALAAILLTAAPAAARDAPPPAEEAGDETAISVTVVPMIWFPRATGGASLGSTPLAREVNFRAQLDLGGQDQTFTGDLVVGIQDTWRLHVDGFHFETSGETVYNWFTSQWGNLLLTTGDAIRTSLDMTSIEFDAAYPLFKVQDGDDRHSFFHISPMLGLRWVEVSQSIEEVGVGTAEGSGSWVGALIGLEIDLGFTPETGSGWPFHRLDIMAHIGYGPALGSVGGSMTQIRAGITIWPIEHLAVTMGFRLIHVNATDGDYTFDGGLQGVFVGAAVRF